MAGTVRRVLWLAFSWWLNDWHCPGGPNFSIVNRLRGNHCKNVAGTVRGMAKSRLTE